VSSWQEADAGSGEPVALGEPAAPATAPLGDAARDELAAARARRRAAASALAAEPVAA
jgi:hypothetical protein